VVGGWGERGGGVKLRGSEKHRIQSDRIILKKTTVRIKLRHIALSSGKKRRSIKRTGVKVNFTPGESMKKSHSRAGRGGGVEFWPGPSFIFREILSSVVRKSGSRRSTSCAVACGKLAKHWVSCSRGHRGLSMGATAGGRLSGRRGGGTGTGHGAIRGTVGGNI